MKILAEQNVEAYQIGHIVKNESTAIELLGITMVKIAIFASGSGSNFENIVEHVESGKLENIEVTALYTDHQNAFCIDRAKSTIFLFILMNQNNLVQKQRMNNI